MSSPRVLGRGLANLIPDFGKVDAGKAGGIKIQSAYKEIPIREIRGNPDQPRKYFSATQIQELANTILDLGIIEPIIVRATDGALPSALYEIISGERRYRAAKLAGYKRIPALIKQASTLQALELGIIENVQREDLNPIEEAAAYQRWIDLTGMKPSVLAAKIGKNRSTVTNLLRILKLTPEIRDWIASGKLTAGQARPLLSIANPNKQTEIGQKAVKGDWSARKVEAEVASLINRRQGKKKKASATDPNIRAKEEQLIRNLRTKIRIYPAKNGSGSIKLQYANLEEFERIFQHLSSNTNSTSNTNSINSINSIENGKSATQATKKRKASQ